MPPEILISIFSALVGVVLGAWLTAKFTYDFQKKLLDQQLQAARESHAEALKAKQAELEIYWMEMEKRVVFPFLPHVLNTMTRLEETLAGASRYFSRNTAKT